MDWYYSLWDGFPPEKLNGDGGGRVARLFSELLTCLDGRDGASSSEDHVKRLYEFYRSATPLRRDEAWLFGDEVKSIVRFRSKFAYIEACWKKRRGPVTLKDFGVPAHILARNKEPLFAKGA